MVPFYNILYFSPSIVKHRLVYICTTYSLGLEEDLHSCLPTQHSTSRAVQDSAKYFLWVVRQQCSYHMTSMGLTSFSTKIFLIFLVLFLSSSSCFCHVYKRWDPWTAIQFRLQILKYNYSFIQTLFSSSLTSGGEILIIFLKILNTLSLSSGSTTYHIFITSEPKTKRTYLN